MCPQEQFCGVMVKYCEIDYDTLSFDALNYHDIHMYRNSARPPLPLIVVYACLAIWNLLL